MPSHTVAERKKRRKSSHKPGHNTLPAANRAALEAQFGTSKRQTEAQAKNTRTASGKKRSGTTLAQPLTTTETPAQRAARIRRQKAVAKRRTTVKPRR